MVFEKNRDKGEIIVERLTIKNSDGSYSQPMDTNFDEVFNKLGELEDVLEEFELTSAEDLRNHLNFKDNMAIWEGELNYKNKIAKLEQELAEFKQKAILPKFQIGQTLYIIPTRFNRLTKIKDYELLSINLSDIGIRYNMVINKKESGVEPFYCASEEMFGKSIFATKEEAESELKGEKNNGNKKNK